MEWVMVRCGAQMALEMGITWDYGIQYQVEGHLEIAKQGSGHGVRLSADKGGCLGQRQVMQAAEC
jgi:hypothetical protein